MKARIACHDQGEAKIIEDSDPTIFWQYKKQTIYFNFSICSLKEIFVNTLQETFIKEFNLARQSSID
jgi:hypothetical protein